MISPSLIPISPRHWVFLPMTFWEAILFAFTEHLPELMVRSLPFENFTGSITGQQEQRQAFNFIVLVKCSPITDATVPGTWIVEMDDLYGDGWDGAFLTIEIDGVATNYTVSAGQGSAATHIINVPAGTAELVISYTSGAF